MGRKIYVVWEGRKKGIFTSWSECKESVHGFLGAKYKSFTEKSLAEEALKGNYETYKGKNTTNKTLNPELKKKYGSPDLYSIAVDAACSGNPGIVEYQGVFCESKTLLFKHRTFQQGTNNIGEFLALVHALGYCKQKKLKDMLIYSDSKIAISWVKQKKCKSKLNPIEENKPLFELIKRAEKWLNKNTYQNPIQKWHTKAWGEIPADFGRKH